MSNNTYYTYRIRLTNYDRVQAVVRDPNGRDIREPSGAFGYKDAQKEKVNALVQQMQVNETTGSDAAKALGEALFNTLFDAGLRSDFSTLYNQAVHRERMLLRIELDVDEIKMPDVAALPWEFMRVPENANLGTLWLGTAPDLIFSRRRSQWHVPNPVQLAKDEKLRIALAVAAPENLGSVVYDKVEIGLQKLAAKMPGKIEFLPVVTGADAEKIDALLAQDPHIFHFIGHGRLVEAEGKSKGQIALVDDMFGEAIWVDADFFSDLLNTHRPGTVFLQACEGGQLSSSQAFVGVASKVVQQNIPVVVAMQYEVSNTTAVRFALKFYQQLAEMYPVDRAAQNGRRAIALNTQYKGRDFATPVLFMRVADGHLFVREGSTAGQQAETTIAQPPAEPREIPPTPETLTLPQVASLGRQISTNFNEEELRGFCLELGVDYEDLRGGGKSSKARELADYCRRQGKVPLLWQKLYEFKGHGKWHV